MVVYLISYGVSILLARTKHYYLSGAVLLLAALYSGLPADQEFDSSARIVFLVLGWRTGVSLYEIEPSSERLDWKNLDLFCTCFSGILDCI